MSLDLLDRLICDIISITQALMEAGESAVPALHPTPTGLLEKERRSLGQKDEERKKFGSQRPMSDGVHRSVC